VLAPRITQDLRSLGATGFTVVDGGGEGSRGLHAGEIPGVPVRIDSIVAPDVADRIVEHIATHYFATYAVIACVSDVSVVRGGTYLLPHPLPPAAWPA